MKLYKLPLSEKIETMSRRFHIWIKEVSSIEVVDWERLKIRTLVFAVVYVNLQEDYKTFHGKQSPLPHSELVGPAPSVPHLGPVVSDGSHPPGPRQLRVVQWRCPFSPAQICPADLGRASDRL